MDKYVSMFSNHSGSHPVNDFLNGSGIIMSDAGYVIVNKVIGLLRIVCTLYTIQDCATFFTIIIMHTAVSHTAV